MNKTQQNLANAFAGESQARNRYTYFAKIAQKEGYEQISNIFLETAENEKQHAKMFYKLLGNGTFKIDSEYPFFLGTTIENLKSAIAGEHEEWSKLYLNASKIAKEEGELEASNLFLQISEAEKHHEDRFFKLFKNIENGLVFKKITDVEWKCRKCGRIIKSSKAPDICPTCKHDKSYFEILCENY